MNDAVITFDVDWAPDFAIRETAEILIKSHTKSTWFVTHNSEAVQELLEQPHLFELGVHPNFMPGTTQGNSYNEIMRHVMDIVPGAKAARTHGMFYSAAISRMFAVDFGLETDSSIYLRECPHITPHLAYYGNRTLLRMPYFWTEDGEMSKPESSFVLKDSTLLLPGLKVFGFHPIHIFLNSSSDHAYNCLKQAYDIRHCTKKDACAYVNNECNGASSLLKQLIMANPNPKGFRTISEIADQWRAKK